MAEESGKYKQVQWVYYICIQGKYKINMFGSDLDMFNKTLLVSRVHPLKEEKKIR